MRVFPENKIARKRDIKYYATVKAKIDLKFFFNNFNWFKNKRTDLKIKDKLFWEEEILNNKIS